MSLECSECECDLRGGHDESCSRHRFCQCGHGQRDHDDNECTKCDCRWYTPDRRAADRDPPPPVVDKMVPSRPTGDDHA